ncbi:hypothetical protein I1A62_25085 [Rhodococcus sp. USK10]|uniref:hypothetical protein n=1 Tax=Rhodococcus sp. USK10 TaxID=2789739 RepID=UPI001C5DD6F5|nr:hypothetical protein [Rhodococcus sp. USK10]QYB07506.1 hypothetical protein I1A62_25085 [Rhodococcus sp. USK10]
MLADRQRLTPEPGSQQTLTVFVDDEPVPAHRLWHPADTVTTTLSWLDEQHLPAEIRSLAEEGPNGYGRGAFYVDRYPGSSTAHVVSVRGVVASIEVVANLALSTDDGWKLLPGTVQMWCVPDTGTWRMPNRQCSVPGTTGDLRFIEQHEFFERYGVATPTFRRDSRYSRVVLYLTE